MVLNTTVVSNIPAAESSKGGNNAQLVVNTIALNNREFNEFVTITEGMQHKTHQRKSQRRSRNNTIAATMTRKELFESNNLDDDQFLHALEYQNSHDDRSFSNPVSQKSMENLMKYFDEDVEVNDSSVKASPTKVKVMGKVASIVASLCSKASNKTPSPLSKCKNKQNLDPKSNIQELKKRYELSPEVPTYKLSKSSKLSPKFLRKSKVKQMASMFNTKLNAVIRKDSSEQKTPEPVSPGLKPIASPNFTSILKPKSPKLKAKLPIFTVKLPSPKPTPLFKRRQMQKAPSVSSLSSSPAMQRKHPGITCLVAENVFSQLTVKDKVLLYNKFIEDMSKKNSKFSKHAQILGSNMQKEIVCGEVVVEKLGSVKHLRDSLEAKFTPTKVMCKTLKCFNQAPSDLSLPSTPKAKSNEFEDISSSATPETPSTPCADCRGGRLHVSTLTVVLKPSPEAKKYATKPRSTHKKCKVSFLNDFCVLEPTIKRTQEMIRSSLPVEPYAPPKKIRRTQREPLSPRTFFKNKYLETLFYNWLKEKNGVAFDIMPINNKNDVIEIVPNNSKDDVISKEKADLLLEDVINKLETEKREAQQEQQVEEQGEQKADTANNNESVIELIKQKVEEENSLEKSIIEVELPLEAEVPVKNEEATNKEPELVDNDLAFTSINKTTSEDSRVELPQQQTSSCPKLLRRKKLRRFIIGKEENSLAESQLRIFTDSDSDSKSQNTNKPFNSFTLPKTKKCSNYVKKLLFKKANSSTSSSNSSSVTTPELSIVELNHSLIHKVNSPSKFKTAYTLAVMSSPSPPTGSDSDLQFTPIKKKSHSLPSLLDIGSQKGEITHKIREKTVSTEFTDLAKYTLKEQQQRLMMDSFIDQGFETGSNESESPIRPPRKSLTSSKVAKEIDQSVIKGENQMFTVNKKMAAQNNHVISPIPFSQTPISPKKQPSMQVIKEGCILDDCNRQSPQHTLSSLNESGSFFADEAIVTSVTPPLSATQKMETSQFWIATGDFTAALHIHYYEPERLALLSNIFGQKCMDNQDMTFGIDGYKFAATELPYCDDIFQKLPKLNNCSQYWFCIGDVILPFAGKQMTKQKIETFFGYLREFLDDSKRVRFGIDTYEFSYYHQTNDSQELMIGHTGSNGSPIKTSDLDETDVESEELQQNITFSTLGANQSDSTNQSLKSEELINPSLTYVINEDANALDEIYESVRNLNLSNIQNDKLALKIQYAVPEILKSLQNQQHKLKSLEERMHIYSNSSFQKNLNHFRESPEYMHRLRIIISAIDNIGYGNGFDACSFEQLESFMFFLSRYADLCLTNCTEHIEKILNVVTNKRSSQT